MDVRRARRTLGALAVAAALVAWWPAFTLGAWGSVFFEQILMLWAAATAAFVVVLLKEGSQRLPRLLAASLLLPSVWLVGAVIPLDENSLLSDMVTWFGVGITLVGLPFMVWVILQVARPDVAEMVSVRTWVVAGVAVAVVVLLSFGLGRFNYVFLTCEDFRVSGNALPPNCAPGPASLG